MKKNIIALLFVFLSASIFAEEVSYTSSILFFLKPKYEAIIGGRGVFTVDNSGTKVTFAPGNLQYCAVPTTPPRSRWRFADEQWETLGTLNSQIGPTNTGWIDLFGWGTSGYHEPSDNCNVYYQPYSSSTAAQLYPCGSNNKYGYGPTSTSTEMHLTGDFASYDWGVYNSMIASVTRYDMSIDKPYNILDDITSCVNYPDYTWRVLTQAEWSYLIDTRKVEYGEQVAWCIAKIEGKAEGLLLFPDGFSLRRYTNVSLTENCYGGNVTITLDEWKYLEAVGCVFLPCGGRRSGNTVSQLENGFYWSSTAANDGRSVSGAYCVHFRSGTVSANSLRTRQENERYCGNSVRLVHELKGTKINDFNITLTEANNCTHFYDTKTRKSTDTIFCVDTYQWVLDYETTTKTKTITQTDAMGDHYDTLKTADGLNDSIISHLHLIRNTGSETRETFDTVFCGDVYIWDLEYKTIEIIPNEDETDYHDTLRSVGDCDSIHYILHLKVAFQPVEGFSVSETKKVKFAPGNLQYCPAQNKWRFAERQFDRVGNGKQAVIPGGAFQTKGYGITTVFRDSAGYTVPCNNSLVSPTYEGWMDHFPWMSSGENGLMQPYAFSSCDEVNFDIQNDPWVDWGVNVIGNYLPNTYRTLTRDEWDYLLRTRQDIMRDTYAYIRLKYGNNSTDTVTGIVIYPDKDDFRWRNANVEKIKSFTEIDIFEWSKLEEAGCAFLPCAGMTTKVHESIGPFYDEKDYCYPFVGYRKWKGVEEGFQLVGEDEFGLDALYWTATARNNGDAYILSCSTRVSIWNYFEIGYEGLPVRLVKDIKNNESDVYIVKQEKEQYDFVCGDNYVWDLGYKKIPIIQKEEQATYYDTLRSIGGCDSSVYILHLKRVNIEVDRRPQEAVVCNNDPYVWDMGYKTETITPTEHGTTEYHDTLRSIISGCDSVISTLKLTNIQPKTNEKEVTVRCGETYIWDMEYKKISITPTEEKNQDYYDTLRSIITGCDSIYSILHLTRVESVENREKRDTIDCETYIWDLEYKRIEIIQAETEKDYYDTLRSTIGGCDSIISHLHLQVGIKASDGFSVSATKIVNFSPGNLQYQASTKTWRFAPNQYDIIGDDNKYISGTYSGWIDLFGWGASGVGKAEAPYETADYAFTYVDWNDWGQNVIGDYPANTWRTLTKAEWDYLLNTRKVNDGAGYSFVHLKYGATVSDAVTGIVLYPDTFTFAEAGVTPIAVGANAGVTEITLDTWHNLEKVNCVFLPGASRRDGKTVDNLYNTTAMYWSSTDYIRWAYEVAFKFQDKTINMRTVQMHYGNSVRLVRDVTNSADEKYIFKRSKKEQFDTVWCDNTYIWDLGSKKIPITQAEQKRIYYDTLRSIGGCDSIYLFLHLTRVESKENREKRDTIDCGETYIWDLGHKQIEIIQTESEKDYYDTLRSTLNGCDSIISHLHLQIISLVDFSVSATKKVNFSPGNLQYQASTNTWQFAPNQYDIIGDDNKYISETYSGWIDLFGWATSGVGGANAPFETYNYPFYNKKWSDWGQNVIGDYPANTWRTPTKNEWDYLFNTRKVSDNAGYSFVRLQYGNNASDTVTGVVLYPDGFTFAKAGVSAIAVGASAGVTEITLDTWRNLEKLNCVFLPGASRRSGTTVDNLYNTNAMYWSSIAYDENKAYKIEFKFQDKKIDIRDDRCSYGNSVRLVKDVASSVDEQYDFVCGDNTYIWDVGYKKIPITQKEEQATYYDTLRSIGGCDSSVYILHLTRLDIKVDIRPKEALVCNNSPFIWDMGYKTVKVIPTEHGKTEYRDTLRSTIGGCDSVISILTLTNIQPAINKKEVEVHCGDVYVWDMDYKILEITQAEEGPTLYYDTLRSIVGGCDSIYSILEVRRIPPIDKRAKEDTVLCGEEYTWDLGYKKRSINQKEPERDYYDTLHSTMGDCDSIISHLHLKQVMVLTQGEFSVSDTKKVNFSPGNLQYCGLQDKWRFAERQFDRCGEGGAETTVYWDDNGTPTKCDNNQVSETYGGWIDLFGWGTSGLKGANPAYFLSETNEDYSWSDWGQNVIGDDPANTWRTLTQSEWEYLLTTRQVNGDVGYSFVSLKYGDNAADTVTGCIIYPDDFTWEKAGVSAIAVGAEVGITPINASYWEALQNVGVVFLPSCFYRLIYNGEPYIPKGGYTYAYQTCYWSATEYSAARSAYNVKFAFWHKYLSPKAYDAKGYGCAVRLVKDIEKYVCVKTKEQNRFITIGETYTWDMGYKKQTINPTKLGQKIYRDTLRSVDGCDSIMSVLYLTVLTPFNSGEFSVSDTKKVKFSRGNLQYCAARNVWRFAERQFDRVGTGQQAVIPGGEEFQTPGYGITTVFWDSVGHIVPSNNALISPTYGGWIDLFGWGTSGFRGGNPPYSISKDRENYFWSDWGQNTINGERHNTWRTPTVEEMTYLLKRQVNGGAAFSFVKLKYGDHSTDTVSGVILYPDDFTWEKAGVYSIRRGEDVSSQIDISYWNSLENAGCVFLPFAGMRFNIDLNNDILDVAVHVYTYYWTSSVDRREYYADAAYYVNFWFAIHPAIYMIGSSRPAAGFCVRLVQDVE